MKKLTLLLAAAFVAGSLNSSAQSSWDNIWNTMQEKNLFNQVSAGISLGPFDGTGLYVAAPIGNYVQVRAGFTMHLFSHYAYGKAIDIPAAKDLNNNTSGAKTPVKFEGNFKMPTGNILFDVFPFKKSSFRVTAGAMFGTKEVMSVNNLSSTPLPDDYNTVGILLKRGTSATDQWGVKATKNVLTLYAQHTNAFRPYLGLGFGRPVSKHRVNVLFDLGAMYGGGLGVYGDGENSVFEVKRIRMESSDFGKNDKGELNDKGYVDKVYSSTKFWPVMRVSLFVRLTK